MLSLPPAKAPVECTVFLSVARSDTSLQNHGSQPKIFPEPPMTQMHFLPTLNRGFSYFNHCVCLSFSPCSEYGIIFTAASSMLA